MLSFALKTFCCCHCASINVLPLGGYEATLDVLGLSGMQKVTARLIEGIEIQQVRRRWHCQPSAAGSLSCIHSGEQLCDSCAPR
jgi:hypothetical protein